MGRTKGSKSGIHAKKTGPKPSIQKKEAKKQQELEAGKSQVILKSFLGSTSLPIPQKNQDVDKRVKSTEIEIEKQVEIPIEINIAKGVETENELKNSTDVDIVNNVEIDNELEIANELETLTENSTPNDAGIRAEEATTISELRLRAMNDGISYSVSSETSPDAHPQDRFIAEIKKKINNAVTRNISGAKFNTPYPFPDLWVYPPNPTATFPNRENYWLQPIFVWVPEYFWPDVFPKARVPCPNCGIDTHVKSEGWNQNARIGILQDNCCRIISFRYKCTVCEEDARTLKLQNKERNCTAKIFGSFSALDERVLKLLPTFIQKSFPFIVTARSAIDIKLADKLADDLMHGKGFKASHEFIQQSHLNHFHLMEHQYYSHVAYYKQKYGHQATLSSRSSSLLNPKTFGVFNDAQGYNGHVPSEHYLESIWQIWFSKIHVLKSAKEDRTFTREEYLHRRQQLVDGRIWCGDASHKLAKLVVLKNSKNQLGDSLSKPINGIFTIMNEFEQILWQRPLFSASLEEMKEELKLTILKRYIAHGYKLPILFYTDECCNDRNLLARVFQEIKDEGHNIVMSIEGEEPETYTKYRNLENLTFPLEKTPGYVFSDTDNAVMLACDLLKEAALKSKLDGKAVLGFDIEWEPSFGMGVTKPPATIQLASADGTSFLFHIGSWVNNRGKRRNPLKVLPRQLEQLLTDPELFYVGVGIKGDATRIEKAFGTQISNIADVALYAVSKKVELVGRSLAALTASFLKKKLTKDKEILLSKWNEPLNDRQIQYACLDAFASVLCFQHVENKYNAVWKNPPVDLIFGETVQLCLKNSTAIVALGILVDHGTQRTWGTTLIRFKTPSGVKRVIVKVTDVKVTGAMCLYRSQDGKEAQSLGNMKNQEILWDANLIRYANDVDIIINDDPTQSHIPAEESAEESLEHYSTPSDEDHFFENTSSPYLYAAEDEDVHDSDVDPDSDESDIESSLELRDNNSQILHEDEQHPKLLMSARLDIFHAMLRISRTLKKGHGAFKIFMARFRDAMFLVNMKDVEIVCDALRRQGYSEDDVKKKLDEDWVFIMRYCRRAVPSPDVLLKRFDRLCNAFADIKDAKTGEDFFRPNTKKIIKNLRSHIEKSCLSDIKGIPLYVATGKDQKTGLTTYRCIRGTNGTEGYHRHIRQLLGMYCASPRLIHEILMEFNYRWNIRMAVKNRGLSKTVGEFYHQYILEDINNITHEWYPISNYHDWISVDDFEDTGERTGFQRSTFPASSSNPNYDPIDDMCFYNFSEEAISVVDEPIHLPNLTASAKHFARLQDFRIPALPIKTIEEKDKFFNEWPRYLGVSSEKGNIMVNHQMIDFDRWALDWNNLVADIEKGKTVWKSLRRKTAAHLSAFHRQWQEKANARNTMQSKTQQNLALRTDFRQGDPNIDFPVLDIWKFPHPLPPANLHKFNAESTSEFESVPTESNEIEDSLLISPSVNTMPLTSTVYFEKNQSDPEDLSLQEDFTEIKRRRISKKRDVMLCQICGHIRKRGEYRQYHNGRSGCTVPMDKRREKCDCKEIVKGRKRDSHYHRCFCPECAPAYDSNESN